MADIHLFSSAPCRRGVSWERLWQRVRVGGPSIRPVWAGCSPPCHWLAEWVLGWQPPQLLPRADSPCGPSPHIDLAPRERQPGPGLASDSRAAGSQCLWPVGLPCFKGKSSPGALTCFSPSHTAPGLPLTNGCLCNCLGPGISRSTWPSSDSGGCHTVLGTTESQSTKTLDCINTTLVPTSPESPQAQKAVRKYGWGPLWL